MGELPGKPQKSKNSSFIPSRANTENQSYLGKYDRDVSSEHAMFLYIHLRELATQAKQRGIFIGEFLTTGYQLRQEANETMSIVICKPDRFLEAKGLTPSETQRGVIRMNRETLVKPIERHPKGNLSESILDATLDGVQDIRIVVLDDNSQVAILNKPQEGEPYINRTVGLVRQDIDLIRSVYQATNFAIAIYETYGGYDGFTAAIEKASGQKPDMVGITAHDEQQYRLYEGGLDPLMNDLYSAGWQRPPNSLDTVGMFNYKHTRDTRSNAKFHYEAQKKEEIIHNVTLLETLLII